MTSIDTNASAQSIPRRRTPQLEPRADAVGARAIAPGGDASEDVLGGLDATFREAAARLRFQQALLDGLGHLGAKMRALGLRSCSGGTMTNRDRGFLGQEFCALSAELARLLRQAAREEQALVDAGLDQQVLAQLKLPPVSRQAEDPRFAFQGVEQACQGLVGASIDTVTRAKEATERLDHAIVALLEVEARVRAARSVLYERIRSHREAGELDSARMAALLGMSTATGPALAVARPR